MENLEKAIVTFEYTNYKDETSVRRVRPYTLNFTANAYYKKPQWLLLGFDMDKKVMRSFAFERMKNWKQLGVQEPPKE